MAGANVRIIRGSVMLITKIRFGKIDGWIFSQALNHGLHRVFGLSEVEASVAPLMHRAGLQVTLRFEAPEFQTTFDVSFVGSLVKPHNDLAGNGVRGKLSGLAV